jgi:hypothetical protein
MDRRKFLTGLGATAAGAVTAVGTGAFDRVTAGRSVSVNVVGDAGAALSLDPISTYASQNSDGELNINFGKLNPNADHEFYDVFRVTNNGDKPVGIFIDNNGPGGQSQREQSAVNADMYQQVSSGLGTAQHGWFDDDDPALGDINQPRAMPSAYRAATYSGGGSTGNTNSLNVGWSPSSDPHILTVGDSMTPDWYCFDTGPKGGTASGTLDIWAFSKDFAQGPIVKGP